MPKISKKEARPAYACDADLAAHFGVNRATVWTWVKKNAFPEPFKLSRQITRWKWVEVEAWEAEQRASKSVTTRK